MSQDTVVPNGRASWWARFWYYWEWRALGVLMVAVAVRSFWTGDIEGGIVFVMFAGTYLVLIPHSMVTSFRFGYTTGADDAVTCMATGLEGYLRPELHPRDVVES